MEKIRKVLMDNSSILYRIQNVLEFYAKGEDYDKDNGFLAKSLLKDIDDINNQYNIGDEFEITVNNYSPNYLKDEFIYTQQKELLKLVEKLNNERKNNK